MIFYNGRNDLIVSGNNLYDPDDLTRLKRPPYYNSPPTLHQTLSRFSHIYAFSMELLGIYSQRRNDWDKWLRIRKKYAQSHAGLPRSVDEFMKNVKTERVLIAYRNNVEGLAALTGQRGTQLLLVGFAFYPAKLISRGIPNDRNLSDSEREYMGQMIQKMNRILEETADRFSHVIFMNLHNNIKREYFLDDCHLNFEGKRQKASVIGQFIVEHRNEIGF